MLIRLIILNFLLIYVLCNDAILPSGIISTSEDAGKKLLKINGQKHILAAGNAGHLESKMGNAEKASNYEKDRGFFFMKAYGWDREKKNEHLNAEGKQLKASNVGKIFKASGNLNKKLSEKYGNNHRGDDYNKNYPTSFDEHDNNDNNNFAKRTGYSKPSLTSYESSSPQNNEEFKYFKPQVEYTDGVAASYELIEPKTSYYPNKEYTRIHYPISGSYMPEMNYKNSYDNYYKNSRKYPNKNALWNQGHHATKYYNRQPTTLSNDPHVQDNLVEYYGNAMKKSNKYQPIHITHTHSSYEPGNQNLNDYSPSDKYSDNSDNDEDEGRHYYSDKKLTDLDIDKLRENYSKYNDDYAGSQLSPEKVHLETPLEQPVIKRKYRLFPGSHYY